MTTELIEPVQRDERLKAFGVADAAISEMSTLYMPLRINGIDDAEGAKRVHEARMIVKNSRVGVEKTRKKLKEDSLAWGKMVDGEARRLTALLEPIESHLEAEEEAYEKERERIKREAAEAKQRKLQARVDAMQRYRAVCDLKTLSEMEDGEFDIALQKAMQEDARRREIEAEQAAERKRIEEEQAAAQKAEADRLAAEAEERRLAEAERLAAEREKQRIEAERIAAERAELDRQRKEQAEQQARIDSERRRIAEEQAERERAAQAERDRIAAEERRAAEDKARAEREAAEKARLESLRTDREKLLTVVEAIRAIEVPEVSDAMNAVRNKVVEGLSRSALIIQTIVNSEVST